MKSNMHSRLDMEIIINQLLPVRNAGTRKKNKCLQMRVNIFMNVCNVKQ